MTRPAEIGPDVVLGQLAEVLVDVPVDEHPGQYEDTDDGGDQTSDAGDVLCALLPRGTGRQIFGDGHERLLFFL